MKVEQFVPYGRMYLSPQIEDSGPTRTVKYVLASDYDALYALAEQMVQVLEINWCPDSTGNSGERALAKWEEFNA